jgi:Mg-chelatase subunit ChlD
MAIHSRHRGRLSLTLSAAAVFTGALMLAAPAGVVGQDEGQAGCGTVPLDIELIIDRSGSMGMTELATGTPPRVRLHYAREAAAQLVDALDANGGVGEGQRHHVGLTTFGDLGVAVTNVVLGDSPAGTLKSVIGGLEPGKGTPLRQAMAAGAADMTANARTTDFGLAVEHVIVILSDGRPNPDDTTASGARPTAADVSAFRAAAESVYSIAIGEGGEGLSLVDLDLMESLAKDASNFHHIVDASDLPALFSDIFQDMSCPSPSPTPTPEPAATPTPTPQGGVLAETSQPGLPATSTVEGASQDGGLPLVVGLLVVAALIGAASDVLRRGAVNRRG